MASDALLGQVAWGYKILDKIKDGSVGSVFLAGRDGKMFALKMLFEKHLARRERKVSFIREARIAHDLNHPNVIRTYEDYEGPPRPFFVMEYFPSENLREVVRSDPKRAAKHAYGILRRLAEALQYCHSEGVVHRDVKPENVLVGKNHEPKLIDFSTALTKLGRLFSFFYRKTAGTPNYMPPEQIHNKRVDHRADIYAFGVTAFELLTGRPPFAGRSMAEVFDKHCKEVPPRMSALDPRIPSEASDVVAAMLEKAPNRRPADLNQAIYVFGKKEKELLAGPGKTRLSAA